MKIGKLLREAKISTEVPSDMGSPALNALVTRRLGLESSTDYVCASACFFVFVAGIYREQFGIENPLLLIHRPFFGASDLKNMSDTSILRRMKGERSIVSAYLSQMDVPEKYVDLMFSIDKNDSRRITQSEFQSDFDGFIYELRDWSSAKCPQVTDDDSTFFNSISHTYEAQMTPAQKERYHLYEKHYLEKLQCLQRLKTDLWLEGMKALLFK